MRRLRTSRHVGATDCEYEALVCFAAGDRVTAMMNLRGAWWAARESGSSSAPATLERVERAIRDAGGQIPWIFVGEDHGPYLPFCECGQVRVANLDETLCAYCQEQGRVEVFDARQAARNEAAVTDGRISQ